MKKDKKGKEEGEAPLEALRIGHTNLTQDQFILHCGISRTTYYRWIAEKSPPRLTPEQIAKICSVCDVSLDTFFRKMGVNVGNLPKKVSFNDTERQSEAPKAQSSIEEPKRNGISQIPPADEMAILAQRLNIPFKKLYHAYGLDITGVPDDLPQPDSKQLASSEEGS